jgi:predicted kinase
MSASAPAAATALVLPDPCLVVLVGAAGSGKSTLAARLFATDAVLSADAHRALVSGDETNQGATRTAFSILHRRLSGRLADRRTTVVDATNVTSYARRTLVRRAAAHGIAAVAIVLDLDPTTVLARNATRHGRIVPIAAVERQLADLERSLRRRSLDAEGFAVVHVLRTPRDVDALAIEWATSGPARAAARTDQAEPDPG